jgi:hypothetical protein
MMAQADHEQRAKISTAFAERLAALPAGQVVRAVLLPAPYLVERGESRPTRAARQALLREARRRNEETFAEVDAVLAETGGQRVTESGNALGFIVVETTPDGIQALCDLDWVGTVLEDQAIHPLRGPEQS